MTALRVVHVMKVKGIGGAERHLLELLPGLCERGVDAELWLLEEHRRRVDDVVTQARSRGVRVRRLPILADVDPLLVARLWRDLRLVPLVHSHLVHADIHVGFARAARRRRRRPRHVVSVHSERRDQGRAAPWALRGLAGGVDACIAISETTADVARELGIAPARIAVVPYGLAPPPPPQRPPSEGPLRVVSHGRLVAVKRPVAVVEAFARAALPGARLRLVGDGPEAAEVARAVERLGCAAAVDVHGFASDVWPHLHAADAWLGLSSSEGFSLSLAEALAAGLAVVCSDIRAHREVGGDAAVYVRTAREAADALRELAESPSLRAALQERAVRRAERFSIDGMVEGTLAAYAAATGAARG